VKSAALFLVSAVVVWGQTVPGRYVVELAGDPAATAAAKQGSRFAAREAGFAARRAAVRQGQTDARTRIGELGGTVLASMDTVVNALIVSIPDARAAELSKVPGVVKVHPVHRVRALLNHALPIHKVPDAWNTLPLGQSSAGAGIKIGMIDTGIDVNNPAFSAPLPPVDGFPLALAASDLQFTNAKIIVAKNYTPLLPDGGDPDANDRDGHGTGTSMAAAGGVRTVTAVKVALAAVIAPELTISPAVLVAVSVPAPKLSLPRFNVPASTMLKVPPKVAPKIWPKLWPAWVIATAPPPVLSSTEPANVSPSVVSEIVVPPAVVTVTSTVDVPAGFADRVTAALEAQPEPSALERALATATGGVLPGRVPRRIRHYGYYVLAFAAVVIGLQRKYGHKPGEGEVKV